MHDRKQSHQDGTILFRKRAKGPGVWELVYRRYELGRKTPVKTKEVFATEAECPTKAQAENSHQLTELRERINSGAPAVYFSDLVRKYRDKHVAKKRPHVQIGYLGVLKHLEDRWGEMRLDQIARHVQVVEDWLQGDLCSRRFPGRQLARKTRGHLRNMMHHLFGFAIKNSWLPPGNPIDEVTTRKAGPRPVKRNFVIEPEMFNYLINDPEVPPHVRIMIIVAVGTGVRASEFLGMRWEDIDWQSRKYGAGLPVWRIERGMDGRHEQDTKNDSSTGDALLLEPVVEALLEFREACPVVNGWVFGSDRTGRPFHITAILNNHLSPALRRMGERFGIEVPKGTGFHAFRHTYRGMARDGGANLDVQQALMRHSGPAMTIGYQADSRKMREQMRRANESAVLPMFPRTGTDGD